MMGIICLNDKKLFVELSVLFKFVTMNYDNYFNDKNSMIKINNRDLFQRIYFKENVDQKGNK